MFERFLNVSNHWSFVATFLGQAEMVESNRMVAEKAIASGVRVGHVHLKVADLERSLAFYCGVVGFVLTQRYGAGAALV